MTIALFKETIKDIEKNIIKKSSFSEWWSKKNDFFLILVFFSLSIYSIISAKNQLNAIHGIAFFIGTALMLGYFQIKKINFLIHQSKLDSLLIFDMKKSIDSLIQNTSIQPDEEKFNNDIKMTFRWIENEKEITYFERCVWALYLNTNNFEFYKILLRICRKEPVHFVFKKIANCRLLIVFYNGDEKTIIIEPFKSANFCDISNSNLEKFANQYSDIHNPYSFMKIYKINYQDCLYREGIIEEIQLRLELRDKPENVTFEI